MSYRDLLRQRRLAASVPAVPADEQAVGTEKNLEEQRGSHRSHCSRANTSDAVKQETVQEESTQATAHDINTIIGNLYAVGRPLEPIETEVREVMAILTWQSAAELAVVLDDAFEVAPDTYTALKQCRRLLKDPKALSAAKAVWPNLPHAPALEAPVSAPVVEHAPRWLRLVREHCAVLPEDERLISNVANSRTPQQALQIAQQYITTWQHAAEQEPVSHKRDNAGRRAANRELAGGRYAG
ncbi:hypothetical protein [Vreelandella maris]|uniref:Uncharacterized protein n=1 Tax=Vreelandella maris TaxID=2729617 RepID=A0A7Y6RBA3_9GAMM|nr:hypothetical protein [Halomonas maris]NVF13761.1 hypothetical protein [Halomonas maris]|tara:strand:- start:1838 stop:2560 length:723 start_codon:yes stop_codon:yes gene_type:complete